MDDVVFDGLGAEFAFALGLVGTDWVGRFEIKASIKQRFEHCHPRFVLAVVEGEGQDAAGLQEAMRFAPALGEQALVGTIRVLRLSSAVGDSLQRFGRVFGAEDRWVFILERQAQARRRRNRTAPSSAAGHRMEGR